MINEEEKMKKWMTVVCLLIVAAFVFAACAPAAETASQVPESSTESGEASAESSTEASAGTETTGSGKHAIVFKNTGNPYGEKEMEGFENAVKEAGQEAILRAPDQPTAEGQIQIIEELIAQGVDSITVVANDPDALQPALTKAMQAGIKVIAVDSGVNAQSRELFVNQAGSELIGQALMDAAYDMCSGSGEFAILSATSQATNQNAWIEALQKIMESDEKYKDMELVKVAYGDDLRDKSVSETEALLQSYPDLKCIVAPTTVGIAAAGKVLTDKNLGGKVALTGLGLPSEMAEYIDNGVCEYMFLWNPMDLGYLAGYTAMALTDGTITGATGDKFEAGTLGEYTVVDASDGGTEIILGPPFRFDSSNIAEWKDVY